MIDIKEKNLIEEDFLDKSNRKSPQATLMIVFILYFISYNNKNKKTIFIKKEEFMPLEIDKIMNKVEFLRKAGPYFPEDAASILNKSILVTEKIIKIHETVDFIKTNNDFSPIKTVETKNDKEKINNILSIAKEEFPDNRLNDMGFIIDLFLNSEKYLNLLNIFGSLMAQSKSSKDLSSLSNNLKPMIDNLNEEDKTKIEEAMKMLEIIDILNNPSKDKKNNI